MNPGVWHQLGDKSQKLVLEQLELGNGVGVIISPRDLTLENASDYAEEYRQLGSQILIDPQFHIPGFSNDKNQTYPTNFCRESVSTLANTLDGNFEQLKNSLESENVELGCTGLIAPAVVYEPGRPELIELNQKLFQAAKQVGDAIGIPTYATVIIGESATASDSLTSTILSAVTMLQSDGWYYGFEFPDERLPSTSDRVYRSLSCGLALATTGLPVLHCYAGPMSIMSPAFGATGYAIGPSQNLWRFCRSRWETSTQGGGGNAPPRFFSDSLWGTIVFPDETDRLDDNLRQIVVTPSPFSANMIPGVWKRWDSYKHLLYVLGAGVNSVYQSGSIRQRAQAAIQKLSVAINYHQAIEESNVFLTDQTNVYQPSWLQSIQKLLHDRSDDFDYMELL